MAILEPPQEIPSELLADMKKVGGIIRADNTAMKKYPEHLVGEGSELQRWYRVKFGQAVGWFRGQPLAGGVPVGKLGGRNRSWWYAQADGSGMWYVNYFMYQSLPFIYADDAPDWAHRLWLGVADTLGNRVFTYSKSFLSRELFSERIIIPEYEWSSPSGLCPALNFYFVANTGRHQIIKLDPEFFGFISAYGTQGSGDTQFSSPRNISADEMMIYVADTGNHRIKVHRQIDWQFIGKIGSQGAGNDQFESPRGICVDGTHVFIADTGNHRIIKRVKIGMAFVSKIGTWGIGDDRFKNPSAIFCDDDYIYVADTGNHRIKKHDKSDLSFVAKFGSHGTGDNNFISPEGISAGYTYVYVADTQNSRIKKHLKSDLSFVAKHSSSDDYLYQFKKPRAISCNIEPLSF